MSFFIAEVSSNHSQDLNRCFEFIDVASNCRFDAVKFQLFKVSELFAPEILEKSHTHRERKKWELPIKFLPMLAEHCKQQNIQFSCTPFYLDAVGELEPYVDFYKIASYELLWDDLLIACAKTGKPVILSTGMANIDEIKHAVEVLKNAGCAKPTLLHCVSAYPAPLEEANLKAIETIREATGCTTGLSDHTKAPGVIYRAVHRWRADTIEVHIDLEGQGEEFATGHCWLPAQCKELIGNIKNGLIADGDGIKVPTAAEEPDRAWRADSSDGLRPLKSIRDSFTGDKD